jgi:hypothetical protein
MWEKTPMNDRPCVIIEERRNPPIGEQGAVIIWRRKDTHRDNPVTIEEKNLLIGEQETVIMILFFLSKRKQLSSIDRPESRRSLIDTDHC